MQDPSLYSQIKAQVMTQQPQFPETDHIMIKCPRCDSTNTKFCYYNNYNLSQPRHFCKNCRRYWTKGGALRNIPIGGGSRKNNTKRVSNKRLAPVPDNDSMGKNGETLPLIGENFGGHFGDLMEVSGSGSFSSLLGEGHFGNLLDGPSLQMGDPDFGDPGSGQGVDPQLGLESGGDNSECWSGGSNVWPDLSIYTPGSTLH